MYFLAYVEGRKERMKERRIKEKKEGKMKKGREEGGRVVLTVVSKVAWFLSPPE